MRLVGWPAPSEPGGPSTPRCLGAVVCAGVRSDTERGSWPKGRPAWRPVGGEVGRVARSGEPARVRWAHLGSDPVAPPPGRPCSRDADEPLGEGLGVDRSIRRSAGDEPHVDSGPTDDRSMSSSRVGSGIGVAAADLTRGSLRTRKGGRRPCRRRSTAGNATRSQRNRRNAMRGRTIVRSSPSATPRFAATGSNVSVGSGRQIEPSPPLAVNRWLDRRSTPHGEHARLELIGRDGRSRSNQRSSPESGSFL